MPDYTIRDPSTGDIIKVRGDSPPTEQELEQIFSARKSAPAAAGSATQTLRDRRMVRTLSDPFIMPPSTAEGDPDPRAIEEADPGLYAAGMIGNIPGSAA